ncbi:polymorphic toxin type 44 domain-containing protein [Pseudomonas chlororaphis]|uniref:Bacterial toxin 44 domain-containing protein n=1 Tax=Pseudomonas chlororaphis TaxID=587753 RepID=A0A1Q8ES31_9PSED|nr:polymorphic toxin type 44 domain-containing protein [Pseudomonas chlororaphis]OLF54590.1 hypothetical protein BTN82_11340 [Pseudomonas chlororaphis]
MIATARLGDKHACPLPGHGTTPIASAAADVIINAMGAARVGDRCGCGAVITTGFPSILINGRPLAHLGSPTSHGGVIVSGSGDTFGGFVMGAPPGATIINFALLGAIRADGSVDDERMTALLADPRLTEKAAAANALVDSRGAPKQPFPCHHPDQLEALASYIAGEMNVHVNGPSVRQMKALNSFSPTEETRKYRALPFYLRLGQRPDFYSLALGKRAKALAIWTERVGQNRPWDHKPKLRAMYNGVVWHKHGEHIYFYDIWSNIHYGYVGTAGGLSESVLLDGAGAEQIASDTLRKADEWVTKPKDEWTHLGPHPTASPWTALRSWDDVADRVAIGIGIKLYRRHPHGGITAKMIMDEVLAVPPTDWGKGIDVHKCR